MRCSAWSSRRTVPRYSCSRYQGPQAPGGFVRGQPRTHPPRRQQNRWALRGDPRGVYGAKGAELMRSNGVPSWSRGCMTINSATRAPSGERAPGGAEVGRFVLDRMDELLTLVSEVESLMLNQSRHRRDRAGNHADRDRRRLGSLTTRWCPARSQRCSTPGWTTSTAPGLSQPLSSCTAATPATPALSRSRT